MGTALFHVFVGWAAVLLGAVSGALMGLFFHEDAWAGGYGSFRRRMLRLGHISFFGIGFLNFFFALTLTLVSLPDAYVRIASSGFLIAVFAMPACCYLAAWKKPLRHLFPIPVVAVLAGVTSILFGWPTS
jgi:hypothetical protein